MKFFTNKKIAIVFIHDDYDHNSFMNITQNHLEYLWHELSCHKNVTFYFHQDIDDALVSSSENDHDYLLLIKQGTVLTFQTLFLREIEQNWTDSHFLLGHILDRKSQYYEVHQQCFFIDLKKWVEVGSPKYESHNNSSEYINISRSDDNFHDDYTPTWIKAESNFSNYKQSSPGSSIINAALSNGYIVQPFSKDIRRSKSFLPNTNQADYLDNYIYLTKYLKNETSTFYLVNTESPPPNIDNIKPLSRLIIPASGLLPFLLLKRIGYEPSKSGIKKTKLILYDISEESLKIYKSMINDWDGKDYVGFIESHYPNFIKNNRNAYSYWTSFIENFDTHDKWLEWFNHFRNSTEFQYKEIDILAKNFKRSLWNTSAGCGDSLISLSNIFHYYPTALYLSYEYRLARLNELMLHYKAHCPDLWVNYCIPVKDEYSMKTTPNGFLTQAKDFKEIEVSEIPWKN